MTRSGRFRSIANCSSYVSRRIGSADVPEMRGEGCLKGGTSLRIRFFVSLRGGGASGAPRRMTMDPIIHEKRVVGQMIGLYCRAKHGGGETLCPSCAQLYAYACRRLDMCRFGAEKPPCECCPIHCYAPDYRARIREVMRYAGPRMLFVHPIEALRHLWRRLRSRRVVPIRK